LGNIDKEYNTKILLALSEEFSSARTSWCWTKIYRANRYDLV